MKFIFTIATLTVLPGRVLGAQHRFTLKSPELETYLLQTRWEALRGSLVQIRDAEEDNYDLINKAALSTTEHVEVFKNQLGRVGGLKPQGSQDKLDIKNISTLLRKSKLATAISTLKTTSSNLKSNKTKDPKVLGRRKTRFDKSMTTAKEALAALETPMDKYLEDASAGMVKLTPGDQTRLTQYAKETKAGINPKDLPKNIRATLSSKIAKLEEEEQTPLVLAQLDMLAHELKSVKRRRLNEIKSLWGLSDTLCVLFGISVGFGLTMLVAVLIQETLSKKSEAEPELLGPAEVPAHIV